MDELNEGFTFSRSISMPAFKRLAMVDEDRACQSLKQDAVVHEKITVFRKLQLGILFCEAGR